LGSIVAREDSKVADGGSLTFPGFDGIVRPYPRSSGPKDGFPSFLVLSSRSSPGPICFKRQWIGACDDYFEF
jgi:hypothetical protein